MATKVRTHARKTKTGGTTTVHQHARQTKARKGIVRPGHAFKLMGRAFKAASRHKRGTAVLLGSLGVAELTAWLTLRGVALMAATLLVVAIGVLMAARAASGSEGGGRLPW